MADVLSREQRSHCMSKIRGKNTEPENMMRDLLRGLHLRYQPKVYGRPDFASKSKKVAVFVDGCFWHGCPKCYIKPRQNHGFWKKKVEKNKTRDRQVSMVLRKDGWTVMRVWEHEVRKNPERTANRIKGAVSNIK